MKKLTLVTITLLFFFNITLNAQGRLKVRQDQYIQIGYESPTNTSLTFGECSGSSNCTTNNNGNFAIESMWSGLNFWKPWPTYAAGNFKFFIGASGHIGVGMHPDTNDWTNKLQVNGKVKANGYNTWSDSRLKENIKPVENALEKVLKLKAVTYNYIPGLDINKPNINLEEVDEIKRKTLENEEFGLHQDFAKDIRIGYLAQDVEKIIPEIVETDSKGYLSMDYMDLIPMAIEAIKEQQKNNR